MDVFNCIVLMHIEVVRTNCVRLKSDNQIVCDPDAKKNDAGS